MVGQKMKHAFLSVLFVVAGCNAKSDAWKAEYVAAGDKWDIAYGDANAEVAYEATKVFSNSCKGLTRRQSQRRDLSRVVQKWLSK